MHIAPAAVGATQLAPNSVGGSTVADNSLTRADILDAPRAAFASGDQLLALTGAATVVRSVAITAPAAGRVIVNATGYFDFNETGVDSGRCAVTTGTSVDFTHLILAADIGEMDVVPFSGTRGFNVAAGSTTTFNLVCDEFDGDVSVGDTSLTAIFVSGS